MRVISGKARGIKLIAPKGLETRPTEDRIKENVFNILGQTFCGEKVLDLFCGSGAIGIEFLSRGVSYVNFIDSSQKAIDSIKKNLKTTRFLDSATIIKKNYIAALKFLEASKFNFIYMDPPFNKRELYYKSFELILKLNLLSEDGILIIEHKSDFELELPSGFIEKRKKKYGNTTISFWELE